MFRLQFTRALTLAVIVSLLASTAVLADDVSNNLDASVDALAESMALTAGGATGATTLQIVTRNEDGKNGCNLTGATTLRVAVHTDNASVASAALVHPTADPEQPKDTFTSCSDTIKVKVTPSAAGSANITLTQLANTTSGTFNLAPATFTVTVAPASVTKTTPTITWADPSAITYGTALDATQLNATAPVAGTFTYTPPAGTVLAAGIHTLQADFAPADTTLYNATSKTVTLTVNQATATLELSGLSATYDGLAHPVGVTTTPAGLSGVTITYNESSQAPTLAGSYNVVASLVNANYTATNATGTLVIAKAGATISLGDLDHTYDGSPKAASATTNPAGLETIGFTYDGGPNPPIEAGTYTVVATLDNPNYEGSQTGTLTIAKANQHIDFAELEDKTYGDADFEVAATASSGLAVAFAATGTCTVDGSTVTITGAGTCTVTASQAGNGNWNAATDVLRTFSIAKAVGFVVINNIPGSAVFGGSFTPTYVRSGDGVASTASLTPTTCSVGADGVVSFVGAGSCTLQASVSEGTNFLAATGAEQPFEIAKADQTITFGVLGAKTYGDPAFEVSATAGSGLTVSFAASGNCTLSGATVTITGAGSCTVTASQGGDNNWNAAPNVERTFSIAKAAGSVTINNLPASGLLNGGFTPTYTKLGDGTASTTSLTTAVCSVNATTEAVTFIGAGTCTLRASVTEGTNHLAANGADQSISIGYNFEGLYAPVDRPNTLNVSKAGQAIPLKWRLTDAFGAPVTNLTGVTVVLSSIPCSSTATVDTLEEYGTSTSGLQNLGDGYYQYNWKTPTSYANTCKSLSLKLGSASDAPVMRALANFNFKK